MQSLPKPNMGLPPHKSWFSRHMIFGYLFLALAFAAAMALAYNYQKGNNQQISNICVEGTKPEDCNDTIFCIQVVTPARNNKTGEVKEFPTPCDVPEGWEKIENEIFN